MLSKLTLVLLATGLVSIGPVCAQSGKSFPMFGDFDPSLVRSVRINHEDPVVPKKFKVQTKDPCLKVQAAPVSAIAATQSDKLKSTLSPKLIKKLDKNAHVGDFERTRKPPYQSVFGKPMTSSPMTAVPMTMKRVPERLKSNPLGGKQLIYIKPLKGGRFSSP